MLVVGTRRTALLYNLKHLFIIGGCEISNKIWRIGWHQLTLCVRYFVYQVCSAARVYVNVLLFGANRRNRSYGRVRDMLATSAQAHRTKHRLYVQRHKSHLYYVFGLGPFW